jgi:hypothetical protein
MGNLKFSDGEKPLAEADFVKIEKKLNAKLPDAMKKLYAASNGGMPSPCMWVDATGALGEMEIFHFLPFLYIKGRAKAEHLIIDGIALNSWKEGTLPRELLPFAADIDGNFFCINLGSEDIVHFTTDDGEAVQKGTIRKLNDSFSDFIQSITGFSGASDPEYSDEAYAMEIPGLGKVRKDESTGWYCSKPIAVPMLDGKECEVTVEGYDEDECKEEFHTAIANFLAGNPAVLREADEALFRYYQDFEAYWLEEGNPRIRTAKKLWQHVEFGFEPMVTRRHHGDKKVYVTIECNCAWEEEHGLQIVLRKGLKVNKLGGYDGHLTNADAYDDESLENVIYHSLS